MKQQIAYVFMSLMGILSLAACSGSGDDVNSAGGGRGGTQSGFLNLSITDAPIDYASEVWIQFDGVELKPTSGSAITVFFDKPMQLDLMALQGVNSTQMLFNETLPAGEYYWVRLLVTDIDDGTLDSYIVLNDGSMHDLDIPSGDETGLKIIGGLEVIANTPTNMTIDFDLRKSITMASTGEYKLSPVLKLIKDKDAGSIIGSVDQSALTGPACSDTDPTTGNAVYLFDGFDITPDDTGSNNPEPVASAIVSLNDDTGTYDYSFGFIPFGKYTAAFTCQADLDDTTSDDDILFSNAQNISLSDTTTFPATTFR
jgi:hypothetical protein